MNDQTEESKGTQMGSAGGCLLSAVFGGILSLVSSIVILPLLFGVQRRD